MGRYPSQLFIACQILSLLLERDLGLGVEVMNCLHVFACCLLLLDKLALLYADLFAWVSRPSDCCRTG